MSDPKSHPSRRIVSSRHLAEGEGWEASELEYGMIIAYNAFSRWMSRCMAAAGNADLTPLEILVLHNTNHRDREKRLTDICFLLNIEDTHTVNYALRKLLKSGLLEAEKRGKEVFYRTSASGAELIETYRAVRNTCLIDSMGRTDIKGDDLREIALANDLERANLLFGRIERSCHVGDPAIDAARTEMMDLLARTFGLSRSTPAEAGIKPETAADLPEMEEGELPGIAPGGAEGISLVTCCMNREENLLRALESWIAYVVAQAAYLFAIFGLFYALWVLFAGGVLTPVVRETAKVTSMVFTILIGSQLLNLVVISFGGEHYIQTFLQSFDNEFKVFLIVMLVLFVLGFVLDFLEIIYIVIPIVGPVIYGGTFDPKWVTIMIAVNLQTSFLTPPFGFALFYLRGVAPASVTTSHIYRGIIPFVLIQVGALALLWMFPVIVTIVPDLIPN